MTTPTVVVVVVVMVEIVTETSTSLNVDREEGEEEITTTTKIIGRRGNLREVSEEEGEVDRTVVGGGVVVDDLTKEEMEDMTIATTEALVGVEGGEE